MPSPSRGQLQLRSACDWRTFQLSLRSSKQERLLLLACLEFRLAIVNSKPKQIALAVRRPQATQFLQFAPANYNANAQSWRFCLRQYFCCCQLEIEQTVLRVAPKASQKSLATATATARSNLRFAFEFARKSAFTKNETCLIFAVAVCVARILRVFRLF